MKAPILTGILVALSTCAAVVFGSESTPTQTQGTAAVSTREGFLPVTGGKIWYRLTGADKTRPALIALHGGPGASHLCFDFLDALADQRPVVIYDQLGCGKSHHPNGLSLWTIERATEELDQVIRGLGFKKVVILGHSWGSIMAFEYMLQKRPIHVTSLILAGPCMSASRWLKDGEANVKQLPERMQAAVRQAEVSGKFDSAEYQEAMDTYYHRFLCRTDPWPECLKQALDSVNTTIYTYMWGPSEFTATGTLKGYEKADRLKEIKIPTLFTCGEFDEASPATTRYYSSLTPGSETVVFKGASHCHLFEQPREFAAAVRAFLDKVEGQTAPKKEN